MKCIYLFRYEFREHFNEVSGRLCNGQRSQGSFMLRVLVIHLFISLFDRYHNSQIVFYVQYWCVPFICDNGIILLIVDT